MPPDPPYSFDALMDEKLADSLASPLPKPIPPRARWARASSASSSVPRTRTKAGFVAAFDQILTGGTHGVSQGGPRVDELRSVAPTSAQITGKS